MKAAVFHSPDNITCDTVDDPRILISYVETRQVTPDDVITHNLPLEAVNKGYEIFDKKEDGCAKVVLDP
jgi:threonine dehydrogenase-like Zn-dependent dehydrogenase